jgi:hypothetical protein
LACTSPTGRHATEHAALAHQVQCHLGAGLLHVQLAARRRQQRLQAEGTRWPGWRIHRQRNLRHADLVAQIDVERRFHQLDVAVVGHQPLAQSGRHGRLAAHDQQAARRIFQRLDALGHGRLADAQRRAAFQSCPG